MADQRRAVDHHSGLDRDIEVQMFRSIRRLMVMSTPVAGKESSTPGACSAIKGKNSTRI